MNRQVRALAVLAMLIVGCGKEAFSPVVAPPTAKAVRVSPKNAVIGANMSMDFQVVLAGFAVGVSHECRLEPTTIGTAAAVGGTCRITTGATVLPGRLIAQVESVADTATLVIFATR